MPFRISSSTGRSSRRSCRSSSLIVGVIAQRALPIAEYPEIAPPTVNITATYPGASAEVIAETVATPIEQEVNGVDDMLYIVSQSTGDGRLSINVVFKPGTNIDQAQVLVQNRVAVAEPRLPEDVRRLGIVGAQGLARPDDGRAHDLARRLARPAVHLQLRHALREGRADAASTASATCSCSAPATTRCASGSIPARVAARNLTAGEVVAGAARRQPAGRGRRDQPGAGRLARRLHAVGADARPADLARAVREHRGPRRARRLGDAAARRGARRAGRAGLHAQRLPQQQDRDRDRHLPAPGLERAGDVGRHHGRDGAAEEGLPAGRRLFRRLQSRPSSSRPRSTR